LSGGTVVFVHGFPFDGSMWQPQLDALPDGWRGLAPDLRGFGGARLTGEPGGPDDAGPIVSGARAGGRVALPGEAVLKMDHLADDVAALIEGEGAGPAVVCGLSMGGYVTLSLWRRRPELIRALVLADTRAEADTDEGRENRMRTAQTARDRGMAPIAEAMVPALLAERTLAERPEIVDRVRRMITGTPTETAIAALAGMAARRDATADLAGMDVPTLVLVGEHDGLTPPEVARSMADWLPRATLRVIPDAGHVSNLENADAFNRALVEFLETV
jgi:3-oxoadipate enol-lactonase